MISCTVPFLRHPFACEHHYRVHASLCKQIMLCYVVHAYPLHVDSAREFGRFDVANR